MSGNSCCLPSDDASLIERLRQNVHVNEIRKRALLMKSFGTILSEINGEN